LSSILFISCNKSTPEAYVCPYTESTKVAPADEIAAVQSYVDASGITAAQDPSGVFYSVITQGADAAPSVCSRVSVRYRGRLTNGTQFDANTSGIVFDLGSLIVGWQKGLPHIQKGGSIKIDHSSIFRLW
jgi:FKBP-type peptidyl-prolyl cis-trans isomerase FkpA